MYCIHNPQVQEQYKSSTPSIKSVSRLASFICSEFIDCIISLTFNFCLFTSTVNCFLSQVSCLHIYRASMTLNELSNNGKSINLAQGVP